MRPALSGDALASGSRKASLTDGEGSTRTPLASPESTAPTTYFLADEQSIDAAHARAPCSSSRSSQAGSVYGVQSLEESVADGSSGHGENGMEVEPHKHGERVKGDPRQDIVHGSAISGQVSDVQTPSGALTTSLKAKDGLHLDLPQDQRLRTTGAPRLRPLHLHLPTPELSLPSSPRSTSSKSLRNEDSDSMIDEAASQAIISSEEEEDDGVQASIEMHNSAPQLIMPSIKMPSRRPFTDRGKSIGRLKVLIVGESGIGKTSLIESIVQLCEEIVHVDSLVSDSPYLNLIKSKKTSARSSGKGSTKGITEVYASTKSYPAWWSDLDDSRILKRRKSLGDTVLERNLCFIDTPGYNNDVSSSEITGDIISFVEAQAQRVMSKDHLSDGDLMNLLSGNGGPQVDVVFFMVSQQLRPAEFDFFRRLSHLTNVIPLISKADLLTQEDRASLKASLLENFRVADLQPFLFGKSIDQTLKSAHPCPPFSISSATASDSENMDASLLMNPDYVQPLVPSELSALIQSVFEPENVAWLRHSAAKKLILWRHRHPLLQPAAHVSHSPSSLGSSAYAGVEASASSSILGSSTSSRLATPPMGATSSYAVARVADHRRREEQLAQVRLAKWAVNLQRSLQNEKERFEALVRGERAVWLTERLGECVAEGTLVPVSTERAVALPRRRPVHVTDVLSEKVTAGGMISGWPTPDPRDPLGLLRWKEELRRRSWVALQIVGGLSLVGGLALWLTRHWDSVGERCQAWN